MEEHKIGEIFWHHGKRYRVEISCSCDGCAFWQEKEHNCCKGLEIELCASKLRKDGNSVIFVEV